MADFLTYVAEQVEGLKEAWSIKNDGPAFMMWYAMEALELDEDVAYEAVSYDGGNDKDIDLFHLDDKHERILIAQGKFQHEGKYKAKKNELLGLLHTTDWLGDKKATEKLGRPELVSAAEDYIEGLARGYSVEYQYVFLGTANTDVTDQAALFNKASLDDYPTRHVQIIDLDAIAAIHKEVLGEQSRIPAATVSLESGSYYSQNGTYGPALVATIPASELCRLHADHGDMLFARNVRLFLGTYAGSVNAGLRDTLGSEADRSNFWAYNNGVTIVCDSFELDEEANVLELSNFSVVNGCQTTVSLTNADTADGAQVLVRFIAAPERIVDSVIYYTNSQTPVKGWELRGQDKIQKRLQGQMGEGDSPWYYDVRRGETRALGGERARYTRDGKFHVIQHDVLGQFLAAFRGLPYVAYKDKGKIFSTHYDTVFPGDLTVEEALLAWRAGEVADIQVKTALHKAIENEDELDTVILKRGGKLFTVAVMSQLIAERNGATYIKHLKREVATSKKTLERLTVYAKVAVVWYLRATRQLVGDGGMQQLSSLLRTQDTYPQLRKAIDEFWSVQSIDEQWVDSLPKL